jgi:hypothetical protein
MPGYFGADRAVWLLECDPVGNALDWLISNQLPFIHTTLGRCGSESKICKKPYAFNPKDSKKKNRQNQAQTVLGWRTGMPMNSTGNATKKRTQSRGNANGLSRILSLSRQFYCWQSWHGECNVKMK